MNNIALAFADDDPESLLSPRQRQRAEHQEQTRQRVNDFNNRWQAGKRLARKSKTSTWTGGLRP